MANKKQPLFDLYNDVSMDFFDQSPKSYKDILKQNNNALWYNNLGVNHEGGNRLFFEEHPLHVKKIKVWANDIHWKYARDLDALITSPNGLSGRATDLYKFPNMPFFGIILFQPNGKFHPISANASFEGQQIDLDPNLDIFVTVNDKRSNYHDNSGAFDFYLEIITP